VSVRSDQVTHRFHGCYVATLTPFDSKDRLDTGVVRAHTHWLLEQGVAGLCPGGTTGEFLYLTTEEKRHLVEATVNAAAGRAPVIAGIWGLREAERLLLAQSAEEAGAKGVFLPPPIYYPANDDVIYAYYAAVHQATNLPVFAYNIPQYAANTISLECLERLFAEGIIAGVKDSTGKADRVGELVARFGARGIVFAASDGFASEGRQLGADLVVVERHAVVARLGMFIGMRKTGAIAGVFFLDVAWIQRDLIAAHGHQEHIAQIAVSGAGEVSVRETEDGRVLVAISSGPLVALLEGPNLGVGRQLHHAEGRGGPGKSVTLRAGADHRIDQFERVRRLRE